VFIARLGVVAACGGISAYWDLRAHTIPDAAWIGGFVVAALLAVIGGPAARWSMLGGAALAASAFAPGMAVRLHGQPLLPFADWCLATALGAIAGLTIAIAVPLAAGIGVLVGVGLLVRGGHTRAAPRGCVVIE